MAVEHPRTAVIASRVCYSLALALALAVLFGWARDIQFLKSLAQSGSSMKPNPAIEIAMVSLSGLLGMVQRARAWSLAVAVGALAILAASALETAAHVNLGIDEVFFSDPASLGTRWPPGRPSPVSLLGLSLLALYPLCANSRFSLPRKASDLLLAIAWIIPFQAIIGFCENVQSTFGLAVYAQMAPHTALGLVLVATGLILARPGEGLMMVVSGTTLADHIGRLLLLFAVILPPTLFWVERVGENWGFWDNDYGTVVRITGQALAFSWIALKAAATLRHSEVKGALAREELTHAVKARDEFLTIASHELRTPITAMKLQTQILARAINRDGNAAHPEKLQRHLAQNDRGLNRMSHLIEDMLDVSRIQGGTLELRLERTNFAGFVREALESVHAQLLDAGMDVTVSAPDDAYVMLDRTRMEQVLVNLVTNAIRYAPQTPVEVKVSLANGVAKLEFSDHGPGIPEADRERLFLRFERGISANEVSGLGLGLFIARRIVAAHGGTIHAYEREAGPGARFVIDLPA